MVCKHYSAAAPISSDLFFFTISVLDWLFIVDLSEYVGGMVRIWTRTSASNFGWGFQTHAEDGWSDSLDWIEWFLRQMVRRDERSFDFVARLPLSPEHRQNNHRRCTHSGERNTVDFLYNEPPGGQRKSSLFVFFFKFFYSSTTKGIICVINKTNIHSTATSFKFVQPSRTDFSPKVFAYSPAFFLIRGPKMGWFLSRNREIGKIMYT